MWAPWEFQWAISQYNVVRGKFYLSIQTPGRFFVQDNLPFEVDIVAPDCVPNNVDPANVLANYKSQAML